VIASALTVTKAPAKGTAATRALRKIVKAAIPDVRNAFLRAVAVVRDGTAIGAVQDMLNAGDIEGAVNAVPWTMLGEPVLRDQLVRNLRDVFEQSGDQAAALLPFDTAEFNIVDPNTVAFFQQYGAAKVVEIGDATRAGIRASLTTMASQGLSNTLAARLIRPQIGLHEQWATAVANYAAEMQDQLSATELHADVARYAQQLTQARALNIARTESQFAASAGQRQAWDQAADAGLFDKATARRVFLYDGNATSDCGCPELDGVEVGYDEAFDGGDPPRHPGCGCGTSLVLD
jgi:hypothetical protein